MKFSLSLRIGETLQGVLSTEGIVVAEANLRAKKDILSELRRILSELGIKACIPREAIREVYLAVDFPELFVRKKLFREKIGYIRYLPQGETDPKIPSPLKRWVLTETIENFEELKDFLRHYQGSLSTFALNPEISSWFDVSEGAIKPVFHEILGDHAILSLGSSFNQIGFKARENLLLLNTLLLPGVNSFYDELKRLLEEEKIRSRIFTLRNNGMLMSEAWARQFPLYTVEVQFMADLLSIHRRLKSQNALGILRKRDKFYFGKIEINRPELSPIPLNLCHLSIRVPHPILGSVPLVSENPQETLKTLQKERNRHYSEEENIPVILSGFNEDWKGLVSLYWKGAPKPFFLEPDPFWFRQAPICFEHEVFVPYTPQGGDYGRNLVRKIWTKLSEEAEAEGFVFDKNWEMIWEERPIRYLPWEASLIRLGYYKKASNFT